MLWNFIYRRLFSYQPLSSYIFITFGKRTSDAFPHRSLTPSNRSSSMSRVQHIRVLPRNKNILERSIFTDIIFYFHYLSCLLSVLLWHFRLNEQIYWQQLIWMSRKSMRQSQAPGFLCSQINWNQFIFFSTSIFWLGSSEWVSDVHCNIWVGRTQYFFSLLGYFCEYVAARVASSTTSKTIVIWHD